jgi:cytochrome c-type biogenesis protein CcmF
MHLAHLGMAVAVTGITLVKAYEVERDVRMGLGDTVAIGQYTFKLRDVSQVPGPNYKAMRGDFEVTQNGVAVTTLQPEKRAYFSSTMPMTEAAIDSGALRDLYVSLGEEIDGEPRSWSVRVYYKPFIGWLWSGVLLMVAGGLMAAADRRYRRKTQATQAFQKLQQA